MDPNPLPARITDELWWFSQQLLALAPGTQFGGIYAPKAGYHNTRANLLAKPAWRNDYSIRLPADKRGPDDKAAGVDWTFPEAHQGDYRRISLYGGRVRDAFNRRDARLSGWREFLGQADADLAPEGYDFVSWSTRTPDDTHRWHHHFSVLREHVDDLAVMRGMLLVLGWTPPEEEADMAVSYKIESTDPEYNGRYYLSNGVNRRGPIRQPKNILGPARVGTVEQVLTDVMRLSVGADTDWEEYLDAVAGPPLDLTPGPVEHTHDAITTVGPPTT